MDTSVRTLENTQDNIKLLESKGYTKSNVSKPNGFNKVIRYSPNRGVYWFTTSHVAMYIEGEIYRRSVGTLYYY